MVAGNRRPEMIPRPYRTKHSRTGEYDFSPPNPLELRSGAVDLPMSLTSLMLFKGCRLTTTPDRSELTDQSDSIPKPPGSLFHPPGFSLPCLILGQNRNILLHPVFQGMMLGESTPQTTPPRAFGTVCSPHLQIRDTRDSPCGNPTSVLETFTAVADFLRR